MTSANVSFDKIQTSTRKPGVYVEWNTKLAVRNLPTNKQRVLLIAQHSNPKAGKLTALANIYSAADVAAAYGAGSQAHLMALAAIKAYAYADLSLITVADNEAGVAATGNITITGTADTQGVLRVNIGNADTLTVGVAANASAATVAAAIKAAIDAETSLPVTATASEGLVTLTAKNKGTHGNHIRIRTGNTAEGITVAVKAMSGGDADADIGPALNAVIAEGNKTLTIQGRDDAGILLDCSAPLFNAQDMDLNQIIEKIVKPLGLSKIRIDAAKTNKTHKVQIEPGSRAWDALTQYAEANGVWPWMEPDGTLVVGGPDYTTAPVAELVLRVSGDNNNIKSLEVERNMAARYWD